MAGFMSDPSGTHVGSEALKLKMSTREICWYCPTTHMDRNEKAEKIIRKFKSNSLGFVRFFE
jgi:hypothetical protein